VELKLRNIQGQIIGNIEVSDYLFGAPMNEALVHQVMVGQLANARQGTAKTKTRAEVSGGGAKPRPQKSSGRSRQGSIRAPQWKGGGRAFGPAPRSYRHRTPSRMRRQSLIVMLSDKVRSEQLIVLDSLRMSQPKTKEMVKVLEALEVKASAVLVADGTDKAMLRCIRNIPKVKALPASLLNTLDLLNHRQLVMTVDAVRKAEQLWSLPAEKEHNGITEAQ